MQRSEEKMKNLLRMDKQDLIKITENIDRESCPDVVNFHCHTKFSDGSFDPEQLLSLIHI